MQRTRHLIFTTFALLLSSTTSSAQESVRVFILAGQSNMEGQGVVDLDHAEHYNGGKGTLNDVMKHPEYNWRYEHLKGKSGNWVERDDVLVHFQTKDELKTGKLSIGFTGYGGKHHIGPELQFGHIVGDAFDEPVLLIKTAWGGKSLYADFRPPSSEGDTGTYYKKMMDEVAEAIDAIPTEFPELKSRPIEISGFVWMQGWNDMFHEKGLAEYEQNLVHLIHDVRAHFDDPDLPVVIGELGNGGEKANTNMRTLRNAQRAAASRKEFVGNVSFVPTAEFARPANRSPNTGHGHHWFGNAESYFLIGDALGKSMLELLDVHHHTIKEIAYKNKGDSQTEYESDRCKLDLYVPAKASNAPSLVWFHGGGLTSNSKNRAESTLVGRYFADRGIIVAVVNYRLSPQAKFPAYVEDAAASVAWALDNIEKHGGDPDSIHVGGHSAGAYLTLLVGMDDKYLAKHGQSPNKIAGFIPVSSQVDSHWTVRSERGIGRDQQVIDESAPLFHIPKVTDKKLQPMLIIVADKDLPDRADANKDFVDKLKQAGHETISIHEIKNRSHVSLITRIPKRGDETAKLIMEFIQNSE